MTDLASLPNAGRYACVLADPPWAFETFSGPSVPQRAAGQHYNVMRTQEMMYLPVADVVAADAVLFMWIIDTHLDQALALGEAWGFTYKTIGFIWSKMSKGGLPYIGLGHWTRSGGEVCLLFTRGKPSRIDKGVRQIINSPVREHSRKPEDQYRRIEALVAGPRLELFARQARPGWDAWGNQVDRFSPMAAE